MTRVEVLQFEARALAELARIAHSFDFFDPAAGILVFGKNKLTTPRRGRITKMQRSCCGNIGERHGIMGAIHGAGR